jgi:hypothetical protein
LAFRIAPVYIWVVQTRQLLLHGLEEGLPTDTKGRYTTTVGVVELVHVVSDKVPTSKVKFTL